MSNITHDQRKGHIARRAGLMTEGMQCGQRLTASVRIYMTLRQAQVAKRKGVDVCDDCISSATERRKSFVAKGFDGRVKE